MREEGCVSKIIDDFLKIISAESRGWVRKRAHSMAIRLIRGLRYALLLHYLIQIFCFVASLSLFSALYLISLQLSSDKGIVLTWPLGLTGGLFLLCVGLLYVSVREKTWISALQIDALLDTAWGSGRKAASGEVDPETIARIVEEVLDRKLQSLRTKSNNG